MPESVSVKGVPTALRVRGVCRLWRYDGTLIYRGWWRQRELTKADIALIRITEFRRIGRKVRLLEIDTTDDRLLVLSRWDLGTDPLHVLDALTETGFAPGRA